MGLFFIFIFLLSFSLRSTNHRQQFNQKSKKDWILDILNLPLQGLLIPFIQTYVLYKIFIIYIPKLHGIISVHPIVAILINLFFVDYLYYWNHRALHSKSLWPFHKIHHSVEHMDVFATSRNTLWTSFLIVYVWINALLIFLLASPSAFIFAAGLTAALDLWRHSQAPSLHALCHKMGIISPIDHMWHHANNPHRNFGANFSIWDRIHGTYEYHNEAPEKLGIKSNLSLGRSLFYPFRSLKDHDDSCK